MFLHCRMSDLHETVRNVNAAVVQMQDGLRDINTHIEAAMFSYHVGHDMERGQKHLTTDVRRSITQVEQGIFTVKHRFEGVVERVRELEREQRDRKDEEELLEAVEDVESPRKKLKVGDAEEGSRERTVLSGEGEFHAGASTQESQSSMTEGDERKTEEK